MGPPAALVRGSPSPRSKDRHPAPVAVDVFLPGARTVTVTSSSGSRNPLPAAVWNRHANPRSGWSRLLTAPALLYAVYRRDRRLLRLLLVWTALNPVVFRERESDPDDWMTRGVRAEQAWLDGEFGARDLQWVNAASAPVWAYALYAAYRGRAASAGLFGALGVAGKLWFIERLARRHEARRRGAADAAE